jgi:hypothetical protein
MPTGAYAAQFAEAGSTFPGKQPDLQAEEVDAAHWNSTFSNRMLPEGRRIRCFSVTLR